MGNRLPKRSKPGVQPNVMVTQISDVNINIDPTTSNDDKFKNEVADKDLEVLQVHNGGYSSMLSSDTNLNDQGVAFYNSGEYDKAEIFFQKCIEMNKVNGTCESLEYMSALRFLASTYRATHRVDEAIEVYKELIPIQKSVLGPQHNDLLGTYINL